MRFGEITNEYASALSYEGDDAAEVIRPVRAKLAKEMQRMIQDRRINKYRTAILCLSKMRSVLSQKASDKKSITEKEIADVSINKVSLVDDLEKICSVEDKMFEDMFVKDSGEIIVKLAPYPEKPL